MRLRRQIIDGLNSPLSLIDLQLIRRSNDPSNYIPFRKTLKEAKRVGMSVGEYLDSKRSVSGATEQTINKMKELGIFNETVQHVVEIGPGSGRYLEKTIAACHPSVYEIYETASDWEQRLVKIYGVTAHAPDKSTLSQTTSASADLVHAHKVFCTLPIIYACRYLEEMARVTKIGGWVVFDVLTEKCLSENDREQWYLSGVNHGISMIPQAFLIDIMQKREMKFIVDFFIELNPGLTHYFVFKKKELT
jgi:SAM-dependent methyltransferase